jgi:hypothetical protein
MEAQAQTAHELAALTYKPKFFKWYKPGGFTTELMPIIPPDAPLTEGSTVSLDNRGKVPGVLTQGNTWSGFGGKWAVELFPKPPRLKKWQSWGAGIGMQGRTFIGLDLDVLDALLADAIEKMSLEILGPSPVRWRRGSPRRLLMYKLPGQRKRSVAFREATKKQTTKQAVELLGKGQYYNVDGLHPSGDKYEWRNGHPCDIGAAGITEVTEAQVNKFFAELCDYLEMMGYEIVQQSSGGSASSTNAKPIGQGDVAPSAQHVLDALAYIKCEDLDYNPWIDTLRAIKAALGEHADEHFDKVDEWCEAYPDNTTEKTREKWDGFTDSTLGWSYLSAQARAGGYDADAQEDFDDGQPAGETQAIPGPETARERMLNRYIWCGQLERFYDKQTRLLLTKDQLNAVNVQVADYGRSGVQSTVSIFMNAEDGPTDRKTDLATYRPGEVLIVQERVKDSVANALNLWRPSKFKPAENVTDDDVRPWLTHVELIFGPLQEPAAMHFLDCVAYKLQHRGDKINHAILLWGSTQGTGKDSVFEPIFRFIGKHNLSIITPETLAGQFTHYLECEVVIVEEMMNFDKRATANKMKPNLACPPDTVIVNKKHTAPYTIPNIQWWVMFSNYEDAVPLEDTDRRYWVHECCLESPRDRAYYDALYAFYDNGGVEKIAGWLLARNVAGRFDPNESPPMTDAKRKMTSLAMPKPVRWVRDQFLEGEKYEHRNIMLIPEVLKNAEDINSDAPRGINYRWVATALRAEGFDKHEHHRVRIDSDVRQLWVRDPSGLLSKLSGDQIRERYLLELKSSTSVGKAA